MSTINSMDPDPIPHVLPQLSYLEKTPNFEGNVCVTIQIYSPIQDK